MVVRQRLVIIVDDVQPGTNDLRPGVGLQHRQQLLDALRVVVVVGVEDGDGVAVGGGQAHAPVDRVEGVPVLLGDQFDPRFTEGPHGGDRIVRRAVVDHDQAVHRPGLVKDAEDRPPDETGVVVARDDDGKTHRNLTIGPPRQPVNRSSAATGRALRCARDRAAPHPDPPPATRGEGESQAIGLAQGSLAPCQGGGVG